MQGTAEQKERQNSNTFDGTVQLQSHTAWTHSILGLVLCEDKQFLFKLFWLNFLFPVVQCSLTDKLSYWFKIKLGNGENAFVCVLHI